MVASNSIVFFVVCFSCRRCRCCCYSLSSPRSSLRSSPSLSSTCVHPFWGLLGSVSGFKNSHFRQHGVFLSASEDVSHSASPPFHPHFKVAEYCVLQSCFRKNGSFFIPPRNTLKYMSNFEVGGKGGARVWRLLLVLVAFHTLTNQQMAVFKSRHGIDTSSLIHFALFVSSFRHAHLQH